MIPVVYWAQSRALVFLKIEIGAPDLKNVHVEIKDGLDAKDSSRLIIKYSAGGSDYLLDEKLFNDVDACRQVLTGRVLRVELSKAKPSGSGWRHPLNFDGAKTPKWLKTDFERWDDEIAIEDTSETSSRASDLRSALREVENGERKEREARQRQLEESIKRGEKAPPRQEITEGIDLDGID